MQLMGIKSLGAFCVFIALSNSSSADIEVKRYEESKTATIIIKDKIQYDDDDRFEAELQSLFADGYKLKLNAVVLDSHGGNKVSAREIGKQIRANNLNTYVSPNAQCLSACIYILSGGVIRMAYGELGVHRAVFTDNLPIQDLSNSIKDADRDAAAFIESMGLSALLSDAILMTPHWSMREITQKEREQWGLHGVERIAEAKWFRKAAQSLQIPSNFFVDFFRKNYENCNIKAKNFEMTLYECVEKSALSSN